VLRDKGHGPDLNAPRYGFGETFESSEDFARLGEKQGYLEVIDAPADAPKPEKKEKKKAAAEDSPQETPPA